MSPLLMSFGALLLLSSPAATGPAQDPVFRMFESKAKARNLECTRLSQTQAHALYPGQVPAPAARGSWPQTDALACTSRFMRYGERAARDELILSSLRHTVGAILHTAMALLPEESTWHVDAFYPEPAVAAKIAVAARTDLAERGRKVSDRVPILAAGDIAVLGRLPAKQAYAAACARYFAQGALKGQDAFLGLMIIDARETQLHAGLCRHGKWQWLR